MGVELLFFKRKEKKAAKLGGRSTCLLKNKTVRHNSF